MRNQPRHGEAGRDSRTRLYIEWQNMRSRCRVKESNRAYASYSHVDCIDEWKRFESFRDWALTSGYTDVLTLDRTDNSLGYSPANCRWVPFSVQIENRDWSGIKKRCICRDTGQIFESVSDAVREYAVGENTANLTRAIKRGYRWKGKSWSYASLP